MPDSSHDSNNNRRTLYSAPRRFDLSSMLVVTSAFAMLFTCMTVLDAPAGTFTYFVGFVTTVGLAQSFYSIRHDPRKVSIFAGTVYHVAVTVFLFVLALSGWEGSVNGNRWRPDWMLCPMCAVTLVSPGLGYLSGALVAGTFLVADYLRSLFVVLRLTRRPADNEHEVQSPWDEQS